MLDQPPPAQSLSLAQFSSLPIFALYSSWLGDRECRSRAEKVLPYFKLAHVEKGTVLYTCDEVAENGYILLRGCIKLLRRKNAREKVDGFAGGLLSQEDKAAYLWDQFKIPKDRADQLMGSFYDDKQMFRYQHFHTLYQNEEFGLGEMVRNSIRNQTAVAVQDSDLLVINKAKFDEHLRDFQLRKENAIVGAVLHGCRKQLAEQMHPKMLPMMSSALMLQLHNEDLLYNEGELTSGLFFVLEGEVEVRKKSLLTVPKKYMTSENKEPLEKEVVLKVSRTGKGAYVGEEQVFSNRKSRCYSVVSVLNNTLVLKIEHNTFFKLIAEFTSFEKNLIQNAVFKKAIADEAYDRQQKKVTEVFVSQYEAYDAKKKEKMLADFMREDAERSNMFEVYAPEGVFFRDTFQKLEGFDAEAKSPNKKEAIRRFKQKNNHASATVSPSRTGTLALDTSPQRSPKRDIEQKMLFSPKRTLNVAQFYATGMPQSLQHTPSKDRKQQKTSKQSILAHLKQQKVVSKFQQIKKDEAVYKRVLIKNGLFPVDKTIDKSKSAKALVHHNFDEVIKQCLSRKNQVLRRAVKEKQQQMIKDTFKKTVESLRNRTMNSLHYSRLMTPIKGTEQLKKRMMSTHHLRSQRNQYTSNNQVSRKVPTNKIQDCMGINSKPKSSQVHRGKISSLTKYPSVALGRTPEKITFLNHMMKPITYYNSNEL